VRQGLERWLEAHEYESLGQAQGSMSLARSPDPAAFERAQYLRVLAGWRG
jgi:dihydroorotate dehydrogenase (fumarate)